MIFYVFEILYLTGTVNFHFLMSASLHHLSVI